MSRRRKRFWLGIVSLLVLTGEGMFSLRVWAEETIEQLTQQDRVIYYIRQNQRLPDYYLTKRQARSLGWDARTANLCQVLPGRAIGGDRFFNREQQLPQNKHRIWYEADINYRCGRRQVDRLLYSNDGLIYITWDHYRYFIQME